MPIKPKRSLQSKVVNAQRFFTDRTEPKEVFTTNLELFDPKNLSVINYYGMGGIGKTRLINELRKISKDRFNATNCSINFIETSYHECSAGLLYLRNQLKVAEPQISFRSFDFAYTIYWQKLNPNIDLSKTGLSQLEDSDLMIDIFRGLQETIEEIPGVKIVSKILLLAKRSESKISEWWFKQGNEQYQNLENLSVTEIRKWLPAYFAQDLRAFIAHAGNKHLCFFFDSFDRLPYQGTADASQSHWWVQELVTHLPEVLFVVAGKEKLRWEEEDSDWTDVIDDHLLSVLSDTDALSFLHACDITDAKLTKTIIKTSRGSPFYLDLAVDTFQKITRNGYEPKPEQFRAKTQKKILDSFQSHLSQIEKSTLKVLSFCRKYDFALFKYLNKEFNTGYAAVDMPELNKFSFIETLSDGQFAINPIMQRALQDHISPEIQTQILYSLYQYYVSKVSDMASEAKLLFTNIEEAYFYAEQQTLPPDDQAHILMLRGRAFQYKCEMGNALSVFKQASKIENVDEKAIQNARIEIATTERQSGHLRLAESTIEEILSDCRVSNAIGFEGKALVQKALCLYERGKLEKSNIHFQNALPLYKKGIELAHKTHDLKQEIYAKVGLSSLLEELGELDEAISLLNECKEASKANGFEHLYIDCHNGLCSKYFLKKDYMQAAEIGDKARKLWADRGFYRGELVLTAKVLEAKYHLNESIEAVSSLIVRGDELNDIVNEKLIRHMYAKTRNLWHPH